MTTSTQECRFRVWLPEQMNGVLDLLVRLNQADTAFYDALEASIVRDPVARRIRLTPRDRGRDLPEYLYPELESVFLSPLTGGELKPAKHTLYGKGILIETEDEFGRKRLAVRDPEIISEEEYRRQTG